MYLKKLEIQGFKSFATKNELVFPGLLDKNKRGLTVIVGPNGSGKSNIADAIRWVLGEQSMKNIRAKINEDVIFSGSEEKSKNSMAEVSLCLDNSARRVDLPYSELILTRRIFRSGESEYLINNSKTRLYDVQLLLAKANFGQKTYSVIGQGTVEKFLDTTPKERKLFFDDATGVKKFQLKRDDSLNKLINSYKNLDQASLIIQEIEPRLKSLTRQVEKLQKKQKLKSSLKELQTIFFQVQWHKFNDKLDKFNQKILEFEEKKQKEEKKLSSFNNEFNKIQSSNSVGEKFSELSKIINELQKKRDGIVKKIIVLKTQRELNLEYRGNFDLSWLENRIEKIKQEIKSNNDDIAVLDREIKEKKIDLSRAEKRQSKISGVLKALNEDLFQLAAPENKEDISNDKILQKIEQLSEIINNVKSEDDVKAVFGIFAKIKTKISSLLKFIRNDDYNDKIEKTRNKQKKIYQKIEQETKTLQENTTELNQLNVEINSLHEKINILKTKTKNLEIEMGDTEKKIEKYNFKKDVNEDNVRNVKNEEKLKKVLNGIDDEIEIKRNSLGKLNEEESTKKEKLSEIQQQSQDLQVKINEINNILNESRTQAVKYETKLEDVENNVRSSLVNSLADVKKNRAEESNLQIIEYKISGINKELSVIGGIDSDAETEYLEVKDKYDFLNKQILDLKRAIKSLEAIIRELDIDIKEKFEKEFKNISVKFEEYFKILFGGGKAKIVKVDAENDDLDDENYNSAQKLSKVNAAGVSGIDIYVSPPGKKITSLSVLSGGEKALTAIALICAIIYSNPSPFVVLDEVDAALDEANSQRLAQILEDLSHKTQFITITHNRASMYRADIIYGVTMKSNGVSELLSLKLKNNN